MAYRIDIKEQATELRNKGYSLKEISERLKIAKSTASVWVSSIELSTSAQNRLAKKQILGQYKSVLLKKQKRENQKKSLEKAALEMLKNIPITNNLVKLCCALIWWCEGNKSTTLVRFTSSDPTLIKNFLYLFRTGFKLDEKKFRALIHLHTYHDETTQKHLWSGITKIPLSQFNKSYQKTNTAKRTKENYPGCIAIAYYDAYIAKELEAIYNSFTTLRGVR